MATNSKDTTTNITTGILYPKMVNRFVVKFISKNDAVDLSALTNQTIRVLPFNYGNILDEFGLCNVNNISVTFEDDITNSVNRALTELKRDTFTFILDTLDGNNKLLETYTFIECNLQGIEVNHGFDYAGGGFKTSDGVRFQNKSPEFNAVIDKLSDEAQAIYHALRQLNVSFESDKNYRSHTVEKTIQFTYQDFEHQYF